MRVMNNNKTLFESFQQNLKEASVDESWCQEQAEYYFNQDCQDNGNLDEIDYVDILNDYTDNEAEAKRVESLIHDAWKIIKDHIYYSDHRKYIELSDNHTLWNIENDKFPSDDSAADEYNAQAEAAFETFKDETGVDLLALGRSGRHICVELNYANALKYSEFVGKQQELEKTVIDAMNNWEPENESAVENGIDPEGGVEPLDEQDTTVRVVTSQQEDRDYTITDITELNKVSDGDVQPPIDITGLLNEVDSRLNESIGENWGVINYQSTRYNTETGNSNALFELCASGKTYLMSMLLEENGTLLKVNNTKGQTIFKRKTNDAVGLAESYIRQFIPMNEAEKTDKTECDEKPLKERLEKAILANDVLSNKSAEINYLVDLTSEVKDDGQFFDLVQKKIYAFVAELHANVTPCMPTEKDEQEFATFDKMVEALYGKDFVEVHEDESKQVKGTETLKETNYLKKYPYEKLEKMSDKDLYRAWLEVSNAPDEEGSMEEIEYTLASDALFDIEGELCRRGFMDENNNKTEKWSELKESVEPVEGYKKDLIEKFPELKDNENFKSYADDDWMAIDLNDDGSIKGYRLATKKLDEDDEPENTDEVDKVEEPKQGLGTGYASFVRKPKDIQALNDKSQYFTDGDSSYIICSKEKLSKEEFDKIQDNFLVDNELCKRFDPLDTDNYAYNVMELSCDDYDYKLLVDPSGFDYCRYVAKVGGNE